MKTRIIKLLAMLIIILAYQDISTSSFAQAPEKMSYQAIVRNNNDQLVTNQAVGMKISILQGSASGNTVYSETQTTTTNEDGLVNIEIGNGTVVFGIFSKINWSNSTYFIKIETDPTGGTNYSITGTSQMLSVPYALYAKNASILEDMLIDNGEFFVTDVDGNHYKTIKIGSQVWMAENLRTTKYNNGTAIIYPGTDNSVWLHNTSGAYAWYNNNVSYKTPYGALYNWYTVNSGNLCPTGWHVPTDVEWTTLKNYLGGIGGKLKEAGTTHWNSPNTGATDEFGFTALPGGQRLDNGTFSIINTNGSWWSSVGLDAISASSWKLFYNSDSIFFTPADYKSYGFSVRCIKD